MTLRRSEAGLDVISVYLGSATAMTSPLLRRYPYTVLTLPLAAVVLVLAVVWDLNVFNLPGASIIRFEQAEFGEISIGVPATRSSDPRRSSPSSTPAETRGRVADRATSIAPRHSANSEHRQQQSD